MNRRMTWAGLAALGMTAAVACTTTDDAAPSASSPSTTVSSTPAPSSVPSTPSQPPPSTPAAPAPDPVSLQALAAKKYTGGALRVGRVLARTPAYTKYFVTYPSGSLSISGVLYVPSTPGPHPALVLNHGHIDLDIYTNGRGLTREQDYLARRGYVVLHTDYRNHAQSSKDPSSEVNLRLGYTEDAINAVLALRTSQYVDPARIGMLGRSMGGGVTYNVLVSKPGLIKAAVVFAPVSSDAVDNFNRWTRSDTATAAAITRAHGTPTANPTFWRNLSAINFFDQAKDPLLIHHGTADSTCPPAWSTKTLAALKKAGAPASMYTYPGEEHAFGPAWPLSMTRTVAFLKQNGL